MNGKIFIFLPGYSGLVGHAYFFNIHETTVNTNF